MYILTTAWDDCCVASASAFPSFCPPSLTLKYCDCVWPLKRPRKGTVCRRFRLWCSWYFFIKIFLLSRFSKGDWLFFNSCLSSKLDFLFCTFWLGVFLSKYVLGFASTNNIIMAFWQKCTIWSPANSRAYN